MTNKLVFLEIGSPSMFVPPNGERTQPGSLAHLLHGRSLPAETYNELTNQNRDDVSDNQ